MADAQIQALLNRLNQAVEAGDEKIAAKSEKKLKKLCAKQGLNYEDLLGYEVNPQEATPKTTSTVFEQQNDADTTGVLPKTQEENENIYAQPPKGRRAKKALAKQREAELEISRSSKSTQALMGYEVMFPDGVMRLDEKHYSCTLELDDVNYVGARNEDQDQKLNIWASWLDETRDEFSIQLLVVTRQISKDVYEKKLEFPLVPGQDKLNKYRKELNAWCQDKLNKTTRSMTRRRLCTITCVADSYEKAAPKLAAEASRLIKTMQSLDSDARVLNAQARLSAMRQLTHQDEPLDTVNLQKELSLGVGLSSVDLAAPYRVQRLSEYTGDPRMIVGKRYVQSLTVLLDGYGTSQKDNFITELISVPFDVSVALHIRPWDAGVAKQIVSKQIFDVQQENHTYQQKQTKPQLGYFVDDTNMPISMKEAEQEAIALYEELDDHQLFAVVINVLCEGKSAEELNAAVKEVEGIFKKHRKSTPDSWDALREDAFTSTLPTGRLMLPYERNLTTKPLSRLIPFASMEVKDDNGFIMGINAKTREFISYNPVLHEHSNAFVIAQPGQGKSFGVKFTRELQNALKYPEAYMKIIDPEGERTNFVKELGGEVLVINHDPNNPTRINPLDISVSYGENENSMSSARSKKVAFLADLVRVMYPTISTMQLAALDRIGMNAYAAWMLDPVPENIPTFQDIYDGLLAHKSAEVREVAEAISPFINGSQALFNSKTTVDMSNHLISFDLSQLTDDTKKLALLVILDHIWVSVTQNHAKGMRTWLDIDEFQLLMNDDAAMRQFEYFFCRGRKWDLYTIAATQNLDRLLQSPQALTMIQNSPFKTFYNQNEEATKTFASLLNFSDEQIQTLKTAKPGEGIYVMGNKVIHFDLTVDKELCPNIYNAITTRASEVNELRLKKLAEPYKESKNVEELQEYIEALRQEIESITIENSELRNEVQILKSSTSPASEFSSALETVLAKINNVQDIKKLIDTPVSGITEPTKGTQEEAVQEEIDAEDIASDLEEPEDTRNSLFAGLIDDGVQEYSDDEQNLTDESEETDEEKSESEEQQDGASVDIASLINDGINKSNEEDAFEFPKEAIERAKDEGMMPEEAYGEHGEFLDSSDDDRYNPYVVRRGFVGQANND